MDYSGTDLDTVHMLECHADKWEKTPESFWTGTHRNKALANPLTEPCANVVGLYLDCLGNDA